MIEEPCLRSVIVETITVPRIDITVKGAAGQELFNIPTDQASVDYAAFSTGTPICGDISYTLTLSPVQPSPTSPAFALVGTFDATQAAVTAQTD